MSKKKSQSRSQTVNKKQVVSSTAQVKKAASPFANVVRMTSGERRSSPKLKRGAREVITTIAQVADKHGVVPPGASLDEMRAFVEDARNLEPLFQEVSALYETLRDAKLRSEAAAWKTAAATYAMLVTAGKINQRVLDDLAPIVRWFRTAAGKRAKAAPPVAETAPAAVTK